MPGLRTRRHRHRLWRRVLRILPASRFGLDLFETPVDELVAAAGALTDRVRATRRIDSSRREPDLGFLYGTIVTDDAAPDDDSFNLCVFAERQIDRSPTGSGVTARMALDHAKGFIAADEARIFRGVTGEPMTGRALRDAASAKPGAVTVEVGGQGFYVGKGEFMIESADRLGHGFALPARFMDALR